MKRLSSTRIASVVGIATVGVLALTPATSLALGNPGTSPFCTNLPAKITATNTSVANLTGKVTTAWSQQDQKLAADQQKIDQEVTAARAAADQTRTADFTKLQAKATTPAEQTAVQTYITAVNSAISTRRAAYDAARHTFRTSLADAISARRTTVTSQVTAFQAAVSAAFTTAQTGCAANSANGATLRTALVNSLRTARETFQADRKSDTAIGTQVQQFVATRKAAFQAADTTFQSAMQSARQALQTAFGSTSA